MSIIGILLNPFDSVKRRLRLEPSSRGGQSPIDLCRELQGRSEEEQTRYIEKKVWRSAGEAMDEEYKFLKRSLDWVHAREGYSIIHREDTQWDLAIDRRLIAEALTTLPKDRLFSFPNGDIRWGKDYSVGCEPSITDYDELASVIRRWSPADAYLFSMNGAYFADAVDEAYHRAGGTFVAIRNTRDLSLLEAERAPEISISYFSLTDFDRLK